jgi:energy-coupling factor transporter ATP-binding protein EcfA2
MKLVSISGRAGSGKSTLAKALVQSFRAEGNRAEVLSFATPLKLMLAALVEYADPDDVLGYVSKLGDKGAPHPVLNGQTSRWAMQSLGTEWGRNLIHPDLWVELGRRRVQMLADAGVSIVVFDDVRFPNEFNWITRTGGCAIHLSRPTEAMVEPAAHASESAQFPGALQVKNTLRPPREMAAVVRASLRI